MRRFVWLLVGVPLFFCDSSAAAQFLPIQLPPPDLVPLLQPALPPLDKPPVRLSKIPSGSLAASRLERVQRHLEIREFEQAFREVEGLLNQPLPPDLRSATLLLLGEAAYWVKAYERSAAAFHGFLAEFPGYPEANTVSLTLAWAELRLGRRHEARQRWLTFARTVPADPRAGEALLLAATLAAQAGDLEAARDLLDQFLARFPTHFDAPLATLNRGMLELQAGRVSSAVIWLRRLVTSTPPHSLFIGRIRLVTGLALLAAGSPEEAARELREALLQGEDVLALLGLGSAALAQRQWPAAERHFGEARDLAGEPARLLAEYGLAIVAFHQGKHQEFARIATELVKAPAAGRLVPRLAYVLAAVAVEEKRWPDARQWTLRLVLDFPDDDTADDALARLGAGAFAAMEWPLVRESYQLLLVRYPQSPHAEAGRVDLGEALLRTGAPAEARELLERFVAGAPGDPRLPRALLLLAKAQEAQGDRTKAIESLTRLVREYPGSDLAEEAKKAIKRLHKLPLPPPSHVIPPLPPPPLVVDLSQKPMAPLPPPRMLACNPLGTLLGVASEALECGRARFQRGELEEARVALEEAIRAGTDRGVVREARYWLGETLIRLNRPEEAERNFRLVHQDAPASELGRHGLHALGWLALRANDPARALQSFEQVVRQSPTPEVLSSASFGRALALYALGRYAGAREAWHALSTQVLPPPLAPGVSFWLGETLGRIGEYASAEEHLRRFTAAGPHPLLETGILRLGWWALAAGHQLESVKAFRWLLSAYPRTAERAWARAGLVMALLSLDDFPGAREEARLHQAEDPTHPLVIPTLLLLLHFSVEKNQLGHARTLQQELLSMNLPPATRSRVLLLADEVNRREGQSGGR